jgi:hypothetical protein
MVEALRARCFEVEVGGDGAGAGDFLVAVAGEGFEFAGGEWNLVGIAKLGLISVGGEAGYV